MCAFISVEINKSIVTKYVSVKSQSVWLFIEMETMNYLAFL